MKDIFVLKTGMASAIATIIAVMSLRSVALKPFSEGDSSAVYYCADYNSRELERETALFVYEDDFADYNRGETDDDCTLTHVYECGAVVKLCDKAAGKRNERI